MTVGRPKRARARTWFRVPHHVAQATRDSDAHALGVQVKGNCPSAQTTAGRLQVQVWWVTVIARCGSIVTPCQWLLRALRLTVTDSEAEALPSRGCGLEGVGMRNPRMRNAGVGGPGGRRAARAPRRWAAGASRCAPFPVDPMIPIPLPRSTNPHHPTIRARAPCAARTTPPAPAAGLPGKEGASEGKARVRESEF